jgi:hypothetical protein
MPPLSKTTFVDPPCGIVNFELVQSVMFERSGAEQLPGYRSFTMPKASL